ncbi:MAG: aquaporin [Gaiellaceae bacterium]|nr:aquaporin [Gaiellaceae bacterium]
MRIYPDRHRPTRVVPFRCVEGDAARRAVAEFVGTFALIFVGAGSIMVGSGGLVGVALAHGLVIAVMASAVGHISGGHFNPAVTFGFLVTRRMAPRLVLVYWVTQFAAASLAALLLRWIFPAVARDPQKLGAPVLNAHISMGAGLVLELVLTFFLVWVIFATAADPRGAFKSIAGLAIGLTISFDVLIGGPLTGAAMNPARAFGPELVQRVWSDAWIWYVGPFVGAALAALVYEYLYLRPLEPVVVGTPGSGLDEPRPGETALS